MWISLDPDDGDMDDEEDDDDDDEEEDDINSAHRFINA